MVSDPRGCACLCLPSTYQTPDLMPASPTELSLASFFIQDHYSFNLFCFGLVWFLLFVFCFLGLADGNLYSAGDRSSAAVRLFFCGSLVVRVIWLITYPLFRHSWWKDLLLIPSRVSWRCTLSPMATGLDDKIQEVRPSLERMLSLSMNLSQA